MSKDFVLKTKSDDLLKISAFGIENIKTAPCIIFVHGFKGFKDWGFGPYLAEQFSNNGFFVLTFNFSHNGVGESLTEFTELDNFAQNTFSLEIEELNQMIDAYKNGFFGEHSNTKTGLLGHSRGGAIALLTATKRDDVNAIAVWSSVSDFNRYSDRQKKEWKERGYLEALNTRTSQRMRMNVSLLEDLEKHSDEKLNIKKAVSSLEKPLLIVHGEQDLAVKLEEGEKLYEWSDKSETEFVKIEGAGHTFDVKHPFEGSNPKFDKVVNKTIDFFKTKLV